MSIEIKQRGDMWRVKVQQEEWEMNELEMKDILETLIKWKVAYSPKKMEDY